jgi:hypothetical protein
VGGPSPTTHHTKGGRSTSDVASDPVISCPWQPLTTPLTMTCCPLTASSSLPTWRCTCSSLTTPWHAASAHPLIKPRHPLTPGAMPLGECPTRTPSTDPYHPASLIIDAQGPNPSTSLTWLTTSRLLKAAPRHRHPASPYEILGRKT